MPASEYIKAEELRFEILNASHDLSKFNCSKDDEMGLNEFIHDEALQFQKENLGTTYMFFHNNAVDWLCNVGNEPNRDKANQNKIAL